MKIGLAILLVRERAHSSQAIRKLGRIRRDVSRRSVTTIHNYDRVVRVTWTPKTTSGARVLERFIRQNSMEFEDDLRGQFVARQFLDPAHRDVVVQDHALACVP